MNVLVIPEDFRKDQYIVKPLVQAMLAAVGKPRARVEVCKDPLLRGITEATSWARIREILDRYRGMVRLFLLLVDRDGNQGRRALDALETQARTAAGEAGSILLAEHGWQEIEVWALAGQKDLPKDWSWAEIRAEVHPKERYFEPLARRRGLAHEPGQGRKTLGQEAAANYPRVRALCPEDVQALEDRIRAWVAT
ncbi:MAG: hypothetical protein AB1634_09850 [Thermodesulfobacteriota bacterium]